jgi:hypothetical protein
MAGLFGHGGALISCKGLTIPKKVSAHPEAVCVEIQSEDVAEEELVANGSVEHAIWQMDLPRGEVQRNVPAKDTRFFVIRTR